MTTYNTTIIDASTAILGAYHEQGSGGVDNRLVAAGFSTIPAKRDVSGKRIRQRATRTLRRLGKLDSNNRIIEVRL